MVGVTSGAAAAEVRAAEPKTSAAGEPNRLRTRSPCSAQPACSPSAFSIARRAHRAVPVGRSTIARSCRPPSCGLRCAHWRGDRRVHDSGCGHLGRGTQRDQPLPVRPGPGRVGRQLLRPELVERRLRQVPDHAGRTGPAGRSAMSAAPPLRRRPANQEKVARGKVIDLHRWLDRWPTVAHWWLTGSSERNQARWSSYSRGYVAKIMKIYHAVSNEEAAKDVRRPPPPPPAGGGGLTTRWIQETNAGIAYAGRWRPAAYRNYSDGRVLYSDRNGATATYSFYAKSVAWIGPVGSTRGKARVSLDGVVIGVVDLRRSTFKPQVNIFGKKWANVGQHTLTDPGNRKRPPGRDRSVHHHPLTPARTAADPSTAVPALDRPAPPDAG